MKPNEPPRLRDEEQGSPLLRLALTSRDDEPSSGDLDALGARLGFPLVPPPQPPAASGGAAAAGIVKSKLVSMWVGPLVAGVLAGTAFVKTVGPRTASVPSVASIERTSPAVVAHDVPAPSPLPRPIAERESTPSRAEANRPPRRAPAVDSAPIEPAPIEPPPAPVVVPPTPAPPETEVALLQRAKGFVATDPRTALALVDEHAARYPNGMLEQEAEVIAVEALVAAGRATDAAERLSRFRAKFPKSAHLPHLESAVRHSK
jgi:hypothetical protein